MALRRGKNSALAAGSAQSHIPAVDPANGRPEAAFPVACRELFEGSGAARFLTQRRFLRGFRTSEPCRRRFSTLICPRQPNAPPPHPKGPLRRPPGGAG